MNTRRIVFSFFLILCSIMGAVQGAAAASWYVATNGNDTAAGTDWATAKQTIQAAVSAASANDTVIVSNGVYSTGGSKGTHGTITNRVFINKTLTLQSLNGAENTTIEGGGTLGPNGVRCLYIDAKASVTGFTIASGHTGNTGSTENKTGGGVFIGNTWTPVLINNCVIEGNEAYEGGGGIYDRNIFGTTIISNCVVRHNDVVNGGGGGITGGASTSVRNCHLLANYCSMHGGGAKAVTIYDSTIDSNEAGLDGGGLGISDAHRCIIKNNTAYWWGGGTYNSDIYNSLVVDNVAEGATGAYGGGVALGTIVNCVVADNWTTGSGGGINSVAATNSIIWGNFAGGSGDEFYSGSLSYCCTTPMSTHGIGNLTSNPLFADNYHVLSNSPCVNAGYNPAVVGTNDLDGSTRIFNRRVDVGAYELQQKTATETTDELVPYSWMDQFPEMLAIYGGDYEAMGNATGANGCPVWASYVAGLVPTNPESQFTVGITVSNDTPRISWSPNLSPSRVYSILGKTNITDAIWNTSTNQASRFFRVKVSVP